MCLITNINAQTVSIPDTNFEQALIDLGIDTNGLNGNILEADALAITSLNVNDKNISSLEGIQGFTNLEILFCQQNQLTSLDVSQNLALEELECESNQFNNLDVSQNTALRVLGCALNNLSSLDVSNNLLLEAIWFTDNNIASLNLDSNTALNVYGLSNNPLVYMSIKNGNNANVTYIEAQNLPTLSCIQVDDENAATYLSTTFSSVDAGITFSEDCDSVFIPDSNFENYLETHNPAGDVVALGNASSMGDGALNNLTLKSKVDSVTNLNVNDSNINDLQGIEAFTSLEVLFCQQNQLTSLDVSQNLALEELECESNQFNNLDVSQNTALRVLGCALNNLSSLDVSNNLLLEAIWFTDNNIASLNLDSNTALNVYGLSNNPLVYMSIKNGNNANVTYIEAQNLPTLSCIQVDDENAATYLSTTFSSVDAGITFSENCEDVWEVFIPDTSLGNAIVANYLNVIDTSGDGIITFAEATAYTGTLDLSNQGITDVTGLQAFTNVTEINLSGNSIVDLSILTGSETVILSRQGNFKNVSKAEFTGLTNLNCSNNLITNLDVSSITTLTDLDSSNNQLTALNVKNGNNTNFTIFSALGNPDLDCIDVDNIAYSAANWTNIDVQTSFSEDCDATLNSEDFSLHNIMMYPNPTKDLLMVNINSQSTYIVYDMYGKLLHEGKLDYGVNIIDYKNYQDGLYFLNISNEEGSVIKKVIKN